MSDFIILGIEDILELHRRQLLKWGGAEGIHDLNAIEAACNAPQNVLIYEGGDVIDCAAALMWHLCNDHGFRDGNKRVGTVAGIVMLSVNGVGLPSSATFLSTNAPVALTVTVSPLSRPAVVTPAVLTTAVASAL